MEVTRMRVMDYFCQSRRSYSCALPHVASRAVMGRCLLIIHLLECSRLVATVQPLEGSPKCSLDARLRGWLLFWWLRHVAVRRHVRVMSLIARHVANSRENAGPPLCGHVLT